jgi:hypothetical protein
VYFANWWLTPAISGPPPAPGQAVSTSSSSFCGGCTRNGRRPLGLELAQAGLRKLLHMKCHKCHLQINTFNSECCLNIARAWSDKWSRAGAAVQVPRKTNRAGVIPRAVVLTPAVSAPSPAQGPIKLSKMHDPRAVTPRLQTRSPFFQPCTWKVQMAKLGRVTSQGSRPRGIVFDVKKKGPDCRSQGQ